MRTVWAWALVALACALGPAPGCEAQREPAPRAEASATPSLPVPRVELGGCRHLEPGPVCVLRAAGKRALHVWVDVHAEAELALRVDGERVEHERVPFDGGQRLALELPPGAQQLRIELQGSSRWREPFVLALRDERIPAVVTTALTDARSGEVQALARARSSLQAARLQLDGVERLAVLQLLRKLTHGTPEGEALLEETAALAQQLGRPRELGDCAAAGAHYALEVEGDFVAARAWVERLDGVDAPEAAVWRHYYGGLLEARSGELGAAARSFAQAQVLAGRIGMLREELGASEMQAFVLARLNRAEEALASARVVTQIGRRAKVGCRDRARALNNAGWTNLLLAQGGLEHDPPWDLFVELLALVEPEGRCPDATLELVARINLAQAALSEHEYGEAQTWLDSLPEQLPERWRGPVATARDRVALASGRHAQLAPFGTRPRAQRDLGAYWADAVLEAQTLERFGQPEAARAAYLRAEAILDESSSALGADVGRELFLAGRSASVEGLVALLVDAGDEREALCRVRLARARELRVVDQSARIAKLSGPERERRRAALGRYLSEREALAAERREDWRYSAPQRARRRQRRREREAPLDALLDAGLGVRERERSPSCESLASPRPGQLLLVPFEGRERRWLFVATHTEVRVASLERSEGALAAALAAAPVLELVDAAEEIRILAGGSAASQSLHALAIDGAPLLTRAPLSYALDLPAREPSPPRERIAVVIANPSSDLPEAEAEARAVAKLLAEAGWEVRHHTGLEATRARLSEDLARASLLHYAGHAVHRGASGWGAALLLGEDDAFSVTDVLALERVPELVVLTGCETATVSGQTFAGGMNLGRAFVLAGARWVVAADGAVDDALARELGERLHARLNADEAVFGTPAQALRQVVSELRARDETLEWQRFRLLVP